MVGTGSQREPLGRTVHPIHVLHGGKYWNDPTCLKYGVTGIPSVWVLDKKGGIVSDNGRANLEAIIDKLLRG